MCLFDVVEEVGYFKQSKIIQQVEFKHNWCFIYILILTAEQQSGASFQGMK